MALALMKTYDALKAAGAPEAKAQAAAEELAGYENRLAGIETQLTEIKGTVRLHFWMLSAIFGTLLVNVIRHW